MLTLTDRRLRSPVRRDFYILDEMPYDVIIGRGTLHMLGYALSRDLEPFRHDGGCDLSCIGDIGVDLCALRNDGDGELDVSPEVGANDVFWNDNEQIYA